MKIVVLIAEQFDGSGFKVLRAYHEGDPRIKEDQDMLYEVSDRNITTHEVKLFDKLNLESLKEKE